MSFAIFTDACSNLPGAALRERRIKPLPCNYTIDGRQITYLGDIEAFNAKEHYDLLRSGKLITTSLLNTQLFLDHFRPELEKGKDVIYIGMSSGISGTYQAAAIAAGELCREFPEKVISGAKVIMKIFGLTTAHIAIENNKPQAARALKAFLCAADGITIDILPAMYPQGAEKQLIQAITGRQVPSGGLPAAVGCAVFNAATCKAISDAVYDGMPLIRRIVTVSGNIVMAPKNLIVPIGTSFNDLLEAVGHSENPYKVLSGGPMMGVAQYDLSVPTTKGTNAVTILGHKHQYLVEYPQCIRCGKCISVCPMKLMPVLMYKSLLSNDVEQMKSVHMMDCIECGCCAYTCPAGLPLVLGFRSGKQRIRDHAASKRL